jgi:hypothetical protein
MAHSAAVSRFLPCSCPETSEWILLSTVPLWPILVEPYSRSRTAHPGQYNRNFGAVSPAKTVLAQNSPRNPNPGSEPRRVQRLWTKTARKVQSVEQSGRRPAGCWLAGHAIGCKSLWDSHYEIKKVLTQP